MFKNGSTAIDGWRSLGADVNSVEACSSTALTSAMACKRSRGLAARHRWTMRASAGGA
jgi:hypothetical protein